MQPELYDKRCSKCGETKPLNDFYANRKMRCGRDSWCKACSIRNTQAWAKRNPERVKAWRAANRDRVNRYHHNWLAANPGYTQDWERRMRDPDERAAREAKRRARQRKAFVEHVDPLVVLERDDGVCGICGKDVDPLAYHVDHIVALAKGGDHSYANSQTAHPRCNQRKGARDH